jgi:diaminopimelate decarboxylase
MTLLNRAKGLLLKRSFAAQRGRPPADLSLWDLDVNGRGHLSIGGLDALELMVQFGSPLFVVHQEALVRHANDIVTALEAAPPGSRVYYSYKTNCIPGILAELHALGIGAEVISPYELWLAAELGMHGDSVIYNGVDKTDDSIDLALRLRIGAINVDSLAEVDRIAKVAQRRGERANVGVRLALVGKAQFGLTVENGEAAEACRRILERRDLLNLRCVHFNVTSNSRSSGEHLGSVRRAMRFMGQLKLTLGSEVPFLDVGGGFGVPTTRNLAGIEYLLYRGLGIPPTPPKVSECQPIESYLRDIIQEVRQGAADARIPVPAVLIEPGRFITSRAQVLLSEVKSIKQRADGIPIAITDAGRLSVTFPCDFEYHEVFVSSRPTARPDTPYMVTGRVCTSADWLLRNRVLPSLQPGDALAVMDAGAYFSSYSSNFAFPRPAIVMVKAGRAVLIRETETFQHLVAMDREPAASREVC